MFQQAGTNDASHGGARRLAHFNRFLYAILAKRGRIASMNSRVSRVARRKDQKRSKAIVSATMDVAKIGRIEMPPFAMM